MDVLPGQQDMYTETFKGLRTELVHKINSPTKVNIKYTNL